MRNFLRNILLVALISAANPLLCHASSEIDSLLAQLDAAINQRELYVAKKQQRLADLRMDFYKKTVDEDRFWALSGLLDEYRPFNTDSAMAISLERLKLATEMHNSDHIYDSHMNIADIMTKTGMYKEALDSMRHISSSSLPDYLKPYYYHIYRTVYGLMADYSVTPLEKARYEQLTDSYRDSLLLVNPQNSLTYVLIKSDQLNVYGKYDEAIDLLTEYCKKEVADSEHNLAVCAFTLSDSYRRKGDRVNEKKYLIISAISDMKSAVREYISLRNLAVLLYQEGDIERAYYYLKICMDDAKACNARQRLLEITQVFPLINEAYQQKVETQQTKLKWSLLSISLLSILLLVTLYFIYRQMKQVVRAREMQVEANDKLKETIGKLNESNEELKKANYAIAENSYLKEEYIGRYIDQCSLYIEKLDSYRRSLSKIASKGKSEELMNALRSRQFIDDELKDFYDNFDETFLQLFPTFVDDFNSLLIEEERIYPKAGEKLNTELRIFALIRLGITNSVKIAQFLRYSVTTIYNYRTKIRNKALGDRNELESKIMQIGKLRR